MNYEDFSPAAAIIEFEPNEEFHAKQAPNQASSGSMTIDINGNQDWRDSEGQLHRIDGPAFVCSSCKYWYKHGKFHREDGPAMEYADGGKQWWLNDKLHRMYGPAIERADGSEEWWVYGKHLSEEEFNADLSAIIERK